MTYQPGTEVAVFPLGSQFEGGESAYLCVFFGCADIAACVPPGRPVSTPWEWVDQKADSLANEVQGNNSFITSGGASLEDEYSALQKLGLSYTALPTKSAAGDSSTQVAIREQINHGRPVLLCAAEASFIDKAIGKAPYHWTPTGNHCIVVTGYDSSFNWLVRDYASVGNAWAAGSMRTYLASKVEAVSATAVTPYWLQGESMSGVPNGWKDDGNTLTAPNGQQMVMGFRQLVLNSEWDPADVPNEHEYNVSQVLLHNASVGSGDRQTTRDHLLWWTEKDGVHNEPYLGLELFAAYNLINQLHSATPVPPAVTKLIGIILQAASGMNTALSSPQTASTGGEPVVTALVQFLNSVESSLTSFETSENPSTPPLPPPPAS